MNATGDEVLSRIDAKPDFRAKVVPARSQRETPASRAS